MQKEFETIIYKLHELLAVEQLEYHNKTWLSGSEATRSEQKQDDLKYLINRLNTLALDVAGNQCTRCPPKKPTAAECNR